MIQKLVLKSDGQGIICIMTSKVNCNRSNANELRAWLKHVPSALLSPVPALLFHLQIRRKWGFHIKANWTPLHIIPPPRQLPPPLPDFEQMRLTQQEVVACFFCAHDDPLFQGLELSTLFPVTLVATLAWTDLYVCYLDVYRFRKLIVSCPVLRSMQFVYNRATKFQQHQEQVEKPEGHIVPQCEFLC